MVKIAFFSRILRFTASVLYADILALIAVGKSMTQKDDQGEGKEKQQIHGKKLSPADRDTLVQNHSALVISVRD